MPLVLSLNMRGFILEAASQRGIPTMFHTVFWTKRGVPLADRLYDAHLRSLKQEGLLDG